MDEVQPASSGSGADSKILIAPINNDGLNCNHLFQLPYIQ